MLKKIGRFFEEHVEKIILIIVGLLCVVLFIMRVLLSPNAVTITNSDGETEKLSPGVIDQRVWEEAQLLSQRRAGSARDVNTYEPQLNDFLAYLDSSIEKIDSHLVIPNPEIAPPRKVALGQYNVPDSIGQITEVKAGHIRAAAYLPTEPVTEIRTYYQVEHEPNDIDIVTVEGKFDIADLYNKFHIAFVDQVEEQYADPCLAIPVFASVNLQRQELADNGTWSDWQNVPRTQIEQYRSLFESIQDGGNLPPGGLKVQILQFDNNQVQMDLLQPQAYQIASAREDWFPPSLHEDYKTAVRKEIKQERKIQRETERQERTRGTTTDRRSGRTGGGRAGGGRGGSGMYDVGMGPEAGGRSRTGGRSRSTARGGEAGAGFAEGGRNTRRGTRTRGSRGDNIGMEMNNYMMEGGGLIGQAFFTNEVYQELYKIKLNLNTDLSKMREPLVFWAIDDTVEPEKTYQYRIRLGVFNPVAGGKDEVVIWTKFSTETEPVEIPGKLYFYVKNIQDTAKTVTVTVCKYIMGYWRVEDFRGVGPGEAIGGTKEYEPEEPEEQSVVAGSDMRLGIPRIPTNQQQTEKTEIVNYDTRAVIVDVVAANDWAASSDRNMNTTPYYDVLYSFGGADIKHMPVGLSNLPESLKMKIYKINSLATDKPEPLRPFNSIGATQRGIGGEDSMGGMDDTMYQEMMMENLY